MLSKEHRPINTGLRLVSPTRKIVFGGGEPVVIETWCRTLCVDQRADSNTFVDGLQEAEVMVIHRSL